MQRYIQGVMRVLLYKFTNSLRVKNATAETLSSAFSDVAGQRTVASFTLSMAVFHVTVDDTDDASRRASLFLSHRFSLSLLFHNHRSLPIPSRGYHIQTLLTLSGLYCTISSYIGFATRDDVMHIQLPRTTL